MSGTNRLVNSENTKKGGSESVLSGNLLDANNEAKKYDKKKEKKAEK